MRWIAVSPLPLFALPLFALPLALASCVPGSEAPRAADARTQPVVRGSALLRRLALDVPADLEAAPARAPAPMVAAQPFAAQAASAEDALRAEDCLTAAIYYEARSEPLDGQRAVAQVVLNRVRDRAFPRSVCGVVYQGSGRSTGCQFSFTCDGSMNRPRDPSAWERSRGVAAAALAGAVYAPVGTATHYHASYMLPWWASSLVRVGAVGSHLFYRWGGQLERALALRQTYAGHEPVPGRSPDPMADPSAETEVAGVRILRGAQFESGVAVHRGIDATEEEPPEGAGASAVALHLGEAPSAAGFRPHMVAGVRVHRGAPPSALEADPT